MRQLYALYDADPSDGTIPVTEAEAVEMNAKGYGIFWTVNEFNGPRQICNLTKINAWAVDLDSGTKEEMKAAIGRGLTPSMVVETKRGLHVYFNAKDAKPENFESLLKERFLPFYNGDKRAWDIARILRAPGYLHMKDPNAPFYVRIVHLANVSYTEAEIMAFYPKVVEPPPVRPPRPQSPVGLGGSIWEFVYDLDSMDALMRLSGTDAVNGEVYTFRKTNRGFNIWVNGKSTSTWVDYQGHIGSFDAGGPTIAQWLKWYGHDWKTIIDIIKSIYPEAQKL